MGKSNNQLLLCHQKIEKNKYDIILCDVKMPKKDGIEVLESVQQFQPETPVIMISGHGNIETAVDAVKKGAFDFISKPLDLNRLLVTLRNAIDMSSLVKETKVLKKKLLKTSEMIGKSAAIKAESIKKLNANFLLRL